MTTLLVYYVCTGGSEICSVIQVCLHYVEALIASREIMVCLLLFTSLTGKSWSASWAQSLQKPWLKKSTAEKSRILNCDIPWSVLLPSNLFNAFYPPAALQPVSSLWNSLVICRQKLTLKIKKSLAIINEFQI